MFRGISVEKDFQIEDRVIMTFTEWPAFHHVTLDKTHPHW